MPLNALNARISAKIQLVEVVIEALTRNDISVQSVELDHKRPLIHVRPCQRCCTLFPAHRIESHDADGQHRWIALFMGAVVSWVEGA